MTPQQELEAAIAYLDTFLPADGSGVQLNSEAMGRVAALRAMLAAITIEE